MAPGIAGNVYAFDLRFENGILRGDLQEIQPFENASDGPVNIRWDTRSPYPNATWLLTDVAQVELPHGFQKIAQDGIDIPRSNGDYFWDHVQRGHGSGLILLLPAGYTFTYDLVPPISSNVQGYVRIGAKEHRGRIAILYLVEPTSGVHNLRTTWRLRKMSATIAEEVIRINSLPQPAHAPFHITVDEAATQAPAPAAVTPPIGAPPPNGNMSWWKNPAVLVGLISLAGVLITGYWQFVYKPAHEAAKTVLLAFFVKERGTGKPIENAQVILQRPTRQEEQQTDDFGTARFAVDPGKEQALHVRVHAAGYHDGSQEVDAPNKDGGSYSVYLDPNSATPNPPAQNPTDKIMFANPPAQNPGQIAMFAVSGSFQQGYRFSSDSKVTIDTKTGLEVSANITVVGPDDTKEVFTAQPAYNTDSMWQWQNQGSFKGSLDFQEKDRKFIGYSGGLLTHSAYWTPSLGHNITSTDTYLKPISSSETSH